jgi:hypothetical protein
VQVLQEGGHSGVTLACIGVVRIERDGLYRRRAAYLFAASSFRYSCFFPSNYRTRGEIDAAVATHGTRPVYRVLAV